MVQIKKPRFITFEGGEGAGKSTQIRLLQAALAAAGVPVCLTREPGGSPGAEEIRALLLKGGVDRWDAVTELLLFSAARRDHLVKTIYPALARGEWVLCDRFYDSTLAYQGYGYGCDDEKMRAVNGLYHLIAGDFKPDLTFILDIDPRVGLQRSKGRTGNAEQRFEDMDITFHENLRRGFLKIAVSDPHRCVVIPADRDPVLVAADIMRVLKEKGFYADA